MVTMEVADAEEVCADISGRDGASIGAGNCGGVVIED